MSEAFDIRRSAEVIGPHQTHDSAHWPLRSCRAGGTGISLIALGARLSLDAFRAGRTRQTGRTLRTYIALRALRTLLREH
jgi:hypothetical protein